MRRAYGLLLAGVKGDPSVSQFLKGEELGMSITDLRLMCCYYSNWKTQYLRLWSIVIVDSSTDLV